VRHFAYPSGDYNDTSLVALQQCGYLSGYKKSGAPCRARTRCTSCSARVRGQQGLAALLLALQQ